MSLDEEMELRARFVFLEGERDLLQMRLNRVTQDSKDERSRLLTALEEKEKAIQIYELASKKFAKETQQLLADLRNQIAHLIRERDAGTHLIRYCKYCGEETHDAHYGHLMSCPIHPPFPSPTSRA